MQVLIFIVTVIYALYVWWSCGSFSKTVQFLGERSIIYFSYEGCTEKYRLQRVALKSTGQVTRRQLKGVAKEVKDDRIGTAQKQMVEGRRTLLEMECELDDGEGPAGSDTQGRPSGVDTSCLEFSCFLICSSQNSCYIPRGSRPRASGSAHLHVT